MVDQRGLWWPSGYDPLSQKLFLHGTTWLNVAQCCPNGQSNDWNCTHEVTNWLPSRKYPIPKKRVFALRWGPGSSWWLHGIENVFHYWPFVPCLLVAVPPYCSQVPIACLGQYCIFAADPAYWAAGGHFKNTYELLNLTILKISPLYKNCIFQCLGEIYCMEFQR